MRLSLYARATSRCRELCRPNAPIQSPMARPISSGESSCTKWIPLIVFSVRAGHLRTRLTSAIIGEDCTRLSL